MLTQHDLAASPPFGNPVYDGTSANHQVKLLKASGEIHVQITATREPRPRALSQRVLRRKGARSIAKSAQGERAPKGAHSLENGARTSTARARARHFAIDHELSRANQGGSRTAALRTFAM